jgi:phosphoribosyl-dephospho-CoA transferase
LPFEAVIASEEPPLLSDARRAAPASWHSVITKLVTSDVKVRCFGSLAWELLTGLPYLSESSDLDLLWRIDGASNADALVDEIALIEAYAPMRIDGELVAPSGLAAQWREWRSGVSEILVKDWAENRLMAREEMFG